LIVVSTLSEPYALLAFRAVSSLRGAREAVVMTTAAKKALSPTRQRADEFASARVAEPGPMEFVVYEDNGGSFHWSIVSGGGATLVQSAGFGSLAAAERAAGRVHDGAHAAHLDRSRKSATAPGVL
jgi:uncharacterized protein YegP (UPF0339 family)